MNLCRLPAWMENPSKSTKLQLKAGNGGLKPEKCRIEDSGCGDIGSVLDSGHSKGSHSND